MFFIIPFLTIHQLSSRTFSEQINLPAHYYCMQLFLSEYFTLQQSTITISDPRIVHQCHTVLRMNAGDSFLIQSPHDQVRYTIAIESISKKEIIWHVSHTDTHSQSAIRNSQSIICVALPNRMDKAELIVQKLAEIGISQIIFFTSSRSIIRELQPKTLTRLETIALEATEQSFGRSIPTIQYKKSLDSLLQNTILPDDNTLHILLDHNGKQRWSDILNKKTQSPQYIYAYIWPEWWFTEDEKNQVLFPPVKGARGFSNSLTLWPTNLRMETAAIITARLLHNS